MLNQLTLDRGPGTAYPKSGCPGGINDNCWAGGNAGETLRRSRLCVRINCLRRECAMSAAAPLSLYSGEMDFLESPWNKPDAARLNYTQSYSTQNNQVGRCFTGGVNGGGFGSENYLLTEASPLAGAPSEPIIYVAIVDSVGNWVYRLPAARAAEIWPGLGRTAANATVQAAPNLRPDSVNPGLTAYAATFTSNCQATNRTAALAQNCAFNGQQG